MKSFRAFAVLLLTSAVQAAPVPVAKSTDEPVAKSAAMLLQNRKIQKELKLTGDQRIAIVDGVADIDEAIEKRRAKLVLMPNPTADIFDKLDAEWHGQIEKFLISASGKLLSADARNRLKQMDRQIRGIEALSDPAVQKVLALTDPQKKALEKAVKDQEEKITTYLMHLGNDNADNAKEELLTFRKEQMKSLVAGFTEEQRVLWTSLLGEPVKGFDPIPMWFTLLETEDDKPIP